MRTNKDRKYIKTKHPFVAYTTSKFPNGFVAQGVGYASDSDYGLDAPWMSDGDDPTVDMHPASFAASLGRFSAAMIPRPPQKDPLDSILTETFKLLVTFLPQDIGLEWENLVLAREKFWEIVVELARNDSIEDMIERQDLYMAMFKFIQHIIKEGSGLAALVFTGWHGRASWFETCRNTFEQADTYLTLLSKSKPTEMTEEKKWIERGGFLRHSDPLYRTPKPSAVKTEDSTPDGLQLCNTLVELYQTMLGKLCSLTDKSDPTAKFRIETLPKYSH